MNEFLAEEAVVRELRAQLEALPPAPPLKRVTEALAAVRRKRRRRAWFMGACASVVLLNFLWIFASRTESLGAVHRWTVPSAMTFADLVQIFAAALAGGMCVARWVRDRDERVVPAPGAWLWAGLGALSWASGQVVWTWIGLVQGRPEDAFPSVADIGYIVAVPLFGIAILSETRGPTTFPSRCKHLLDGLILAVSFVAMAWLIGLKGLLDVPGHTPLKNGLTIGYTAGDLVLISMLIATAVTFGRSRLPQFRLVAVAIVCLFVADLRFCMQPKTGAYWEPGYSDIFWVLCFLLLAVAATYHCSSRAFWPVTVRPASVPRAIAPMMSGVVTLAVLAGEVVTRNGDAILIGCAVVLCVLASLRHGAAILEANRLLQLAVSVSQDERDLDIINDYVGFQVLTEQLPVGVASALSSPSDIRGDALDALDALERMNRRRERRNVLLGDYVGTRT